ncbi:RNA-binding ribosome biosynthesis protein mak21 [Microbotryomycetes sp. JL221]|nr:RNA-binding ribosome biosynthesis protein mak21 [Microbotryomycetes sp. JL221]
MAGPNPYAKALGGRASGSDKATKTSSNKTEKVKHDTSTSKLVGQKVPASSNKSTAASSKAQQSNIANANESNDTKQVLRREVLALGGDEAEVEMLLALSDSESEIEDDQDNVQAKSTKDKSLSKDLKSFMKGLDFAAVGGAAVVQDDDAEDEQDSEEDGDESSEEEEADDDEDDDTEAAAVEEDEAPPSEVTTPEVASVKKESKREREDRKIAERESAKQAERELKEKLSADKELQIKTPKIKSPWIVDPTPQWYAVPVPTASNEPRPSASVISNLTARAGELLKKENDMYSASMSPAPKGAAPPPPNGLSKADQIFIQQILTSGTSSDKVSALLLLVASSPLHTMHYLDQLANIAKKKSRDQSGKAVRGIVEWWRGNDGEGGGAPSRKLRAFSDQPGLATVAKAVDMLEKGKGKQREDEDGLTKREIDQALVVYAYEDWLKKWFFGILQALEQMSVDNLPHPRQIAVLHLSGLLRDKPEQEGNILRLLVNKLGDTNRNIASKTSHHLLQILQVHPGMTPIIVREVSALILKPTGSGAASTSNSAPGKHIRFGGDGDSTKKSNDKTAASSKKPRDAGSEHARYYGIITLNQIMIKKGQTEVANRLIEVYFEVFGDILGRLEENGDDAIKDDVDTGSSSLKRKRGDNFKGNKKRGGKGKADDDKAGEVDEAESKLVAAILTGVNRAFPYAQIDDEAVKKRLDTLYRITHNGTFNVSIQALMLIYRMSEMQKDVSDRFYRTLYNSLHDPRLGPSSKQALYLNLLFKAVKADKQLPRVMAFVKRLMQVMVGLDVVFILGSLFIVGELMTSTIGLFDMLVRSEEAARKISSAETKSDDKSHENLGYDGKKREPLGAGADKSCLWEIVPLLNHWHPTVASQANQVLRGQPLSATAELEQHSLNHFLDRFVYRDLKKTLTTKGSSMMQPGVPGQDKTGRIVVVKGAMRGEENVVNSEAFRKKDVTNVPVDQIFFHKYFTSKSALDETKRDNLQRRKNRKGEGFSSDEEAQEDDDEASIADLVDGREDEASLDGFAEAMASGDDEGLHVDEDEDEDEDDDSVSFELIDDDGKSVEADEDEIWQAMQKSMPDLDAGSDDEDDVAADGADQDLLGEEEDDVDVAEFAYSSDSELGIDDFGMMEAPDSIDGDGHAGIFQNADEDEDDEEEDDLGSLAELAEDDDEDEDGDAEMMDDDDSEQEQDEQDDQQDDDDAEFDSDDATLLEDEDDLVDSDDEVSVDDAEVKDGKKKTGKAGQNKKQKLKHMPMFASAEDYAHLLGGSDDESV